MFLSKLDSLTNALKLIDDNQVVLSSEEISIKDAHRRVLAEDIYSFHNSPPFDKSAMDGFAVIAEDTFGISQSEPKKFKIIDEIGAGSFSNKIINKNEAIIIATGAPIPNGANAVMMKEYTQTENDAVSISSQVTPGENVTSMSEDFKEGDMILPANTFIRPQEMGLIASAGVNKLKVYKKPKVKLIITGNELVEPSKKLSKAKIINSNQFFIASQIETAGALVDIEHAKDNFEDVKNAILNASNDYDVVITTGGTAISKGDIVLDAVDSIGEILFHGVSIRPGKPIGAGIVNNTMVFTFSGQPVAAMTQFDIFTRKYLFKMQGRNYEHEIVKRKSLMKIPSQLGRTDFIRTSSDDNHAKHILNRGSGIIRSMVDANSYIIINENDEGYQKNDLVDVVFFNSMYW